MPSLPVANGVYKVLPFAEALITCNVALPQGIVTIMDNHFEWTFMNLGSSAQLSEVGMSLETIYLLENYFTFTLTSKITVVIPTTAHEFEKPANVTLQ